MGGHQQRAEDIVERACKRLMEIEASPPYRFVDTLRMHAEMFQSRARRLVGCSEEDIAAREKILGRRYPAVFRAYLGRMGHENGNLFGGADVGFERYDEFRAHAREQTGESLPRRAEVFYMHQGYAFMHVLASGKFDGPVFYSDQRGGIRQVVETFEGFLEGNLDQLAQNYMMAIESGGYFLTVLEGGATKMRFGEPGEDPPITFRHRLIEHGLHRNVRPVIFGDD